MTGPVTKTAKTSKWLKIEKAASNFVLRLEADFFWSYVIMQLRKTFATNPLRQNLLYVGCAVYLWNCFLQPRLTLKIFIRYDNFLSVVWSQGWTLPNKNLIKHTLPTSTTSYIYFKKRHSKFTSYFSNFLALKQYIANTHSQTPKPWIIHSPSVCFPLARLKWMSKGHTVNVLSAKSTDECLRTKSKDN